MIVNFPNNFIYLYRKIGTQHFCLIDRYPNAAYFVSYFELLCSTYYTWLIDDLLEIIEILSIHLPTILLLSEFRSGSGKWNGNMN